MLNQSSERILQHFTFAQAPVAQQEVHSACAALAQHMATSLDTSEPAAAAEVTTGLRKLLEAHDCFVRAVVAMKKTGS